jgi:hypothetical protein
MTTFKRVPIYISQNSNINEFVEKYLPKEIFSDAWGPGYYRSLSTRIMQFQRETVYT